MKKKNWKVAKRKVVVTVTESTTKCGDTKRETSVTFKITEVSKSK